MVDPLLSRDYALLSRLKLIDFFDCLRLLRLLLFIVALYYISHCYFIRSGLTASTSRSTALILDFKYRVLVFFNDIRYELPSPCWPAAWRMPFNRKFHWMTRRIIWAETTDCWCHFPVSDSSAGAIESGSPCVNTAWSTTRSSLFPHSRVPYIIRGFAQFFWCSYLELQSIALPAWFHWGTWI